MDEQERQENSEQDDAGEKNEEATAEPTAEAESVADKTDESATDEAEAPAAEVKEEPAEEAGDSDDGESDADSADESEPTAESKDEPEAVEAEAPAAESADEPTAEEASAAPVEADEPSEDEAEEPEAEEELADAPAISGLIGRKIGMTTYYTDDGRAVPVTAVEVGPCTVTQVKTAARHGYEAVQVGFLPAKNLNKPMAGHLERSGGRFRHLQEFGVEDLGEFEVGQKILANLFDTGDRIKVSGISKGKGFAGGVRRYGFAGGPKTHGQSDRHRAPGSIGAGSSPGRVWPGTKMAGHYGAASITQRGLRVVLSDPSRNLLLVGGSVPGHKNSILRIEKQA